MSSRSEPTFAFSRPRKTRETSIPRRPVTFAKKHSCMHGCMLGSFVVCAVHSTRHPPKTSRCLGATCTSSGIWENVECQASLVGSVLLGITGAFRWLRGVVRKNTYQIKSPDPVSRGGERRFRVSGTGLRFGIWGWLKLQGLGFRV